MVESALRARGATQPVVPSELALKEALPRLVASGAPAAAVQHAVWQWAPKARQPWAVSVVLAERLQREALPPAPAVWLLDSPAFRLRVVIVRGSPCAPVLTTGVSTAEVGTPAIQGPG